MLRKVTRVTRTGALAGGLLALAVSASADFDRTADLAGLARPRDYTLAQISSHDPSGGNGDSGHYLREEGDRWILADLTGPGEIVRIWSANPSGQLRVFFDGEAEPRIDCPFYMIFSNEYPPFAPPLATCTSGGWISYFPIPYARSCRVEVVKAQRFYYHIEYATYPAGTPIDSFRRDPAPERRVALARAQRRWVDPAGDIARPADVKEDHVDFITVPAAAAVPLVSLPGSGQVIEIRLKLQNPDRFALRRLAIEAAWDGAPVPCVRVPLGDFFALGFGEGAAATLPVGRLDDGTFYCRFPMPFSSGATLRLVNDGPAPVGAGWSVRWQPLPKADADRLLRFHAQWRRGRTVKGGPWLLLDAEGSGHYVGTVLTMQGNGRLGFLEGDEIVRIDDRKEPAFIGTGTEDYFNGGWYFKTGPFSAPTHAVTYKDEDASRLCAARFHLSDAIPFTKRIRFEIEHGGENDMPDCDYASVAFWYQAEPHKPIAALPPVQERIWIPVSRAGWVEAEDLPAASGRGVEGSEVQRTGSYVIEAGSSFHGGRQVAFGGRSGDALELDVYSPDADTVALTLRHATGPAYGDFIVRTRGRVYGTVHARAGTAGMAESRSWSPVPLARGWTRLQLELVSDGRIGIDAVRLMPRSMPQFWMVIGPFDNADDKGLDRVFPPEEWIDSAPIDVVGGRKAAWREEPMELEPLGLVNFQRMFDPNTKVVAYAVSYIRAPEAMEVPFYIGADDGVKFWVNREVMLDDPERRSLAARQSSGTLRLKTGWNVVMVKVENGRGRWGFFFQVPDADGKLRYASRPE